MKSMLIASAITGIVIAGLLLLSGRRTEDLNAKNLSRKAKEDLDGNRAMPERSALQTMG